MNDIRGYNTGTNEDAGALAAITEMNIRDSKMPIMNEGGHARSIEYVELLKEISEDTILSGDTAPSSAMADVNASQLYIWSQDNLGGILTYHSPSGASTWSLLKGFNMTVSSRVPDDSNAHVGLVQLSLVTGSERSLYYSRSDQDAWTRFSIGTDISAGTGIDISDDDEITTNAEQVADQMEGRIRDVHIADDLTDDEKTEAKERLGVIDGTTVDDVTIEDDSTNGLQVKEGGIDKQHLNADAVDDTTIENDSTDGLRVKEGGIDKQHLNADAVDDTTIENDSTNGLQIKPGGIRDEHIASDLTAAEKLEIETRLGTFTVSGTPSAGQIPKAQSDGTVAWGDDATGTAGSGEENVQADWNTNDDTSDSHIRNRPGTIKTGASVPASPITDTVFIYTAAATGLTHHLEADGSTPRTTADDRDVFKWNGTNWVFLFNLQSAEITVDDTTIEEDSTNGLQLKDGGVDKEHLNADIVDDTTIEIDATDGLQVKEGGIDKEHLNADAVDDTTIENDSTDGLQIKEGGIRDEHIADDLSDAEKTEAKSRLGVDDPTDIFYIEHFRAQYTSTVFSGTSTAVYRHSATTLRIHSSDSARVAILRRVIAGSKIQLRDVSDGSVIDTFTLSADPVARNRYGDFHFVGDYENDATFTDSVNYQIYFGHTEAEQHGAGEANNVLVIAPNNVAHSVNTHTLTTGRSLTRESELYDYVLVFITKGTNTGATFIVVDSVLSQPLKKADGSALVANDLPTGTVIEVAFDQGAGEFRWVNEGGGGQTTDLGIQDILTPSTNYGNITGELIHDAVRRFAPDYVPPRFTTVHRVARVGAQATLATILDAEVGIVSVPGETTQFYIYIDEHNDLIAGFFDELPIGTNIILLDDTQDVTYDTTLLAKEHLVGDDARWQLTVEITPGTIGTISPDDDVRIEFEYQHADILDDSITLAKMAHGTAYKFIRYDATGAPVESDLPYRTPVTDATVTHSADVYSFVNDPVFTALEDGDTWIFKSLEVNVGTIAIGIDSISNRLLYKSDQSAFTAGELVADRRVIAVYDSALPGFIAINIDPPIDIDVDDATIENDDTNGLQVKEGGIREEHIADDLDTAEKTEFRDRIGAGAPGDLTPAVETEVLNDSAATLSTTPRNFTLSDSLADFDTPGNIRLLLIQDYTDGTTDDDLLGLRGTIDFDLGMIQDMPNVDTTDFSTTSIENLAAGRVVRLGIVDAPNDVQGAALYFGKVSDTEVRIASSHTLLDSATLIIKVIEHKGTQGERGLAGEGEDNPEQVSAGEITAATETDLRSYSPDDIESFISQHAGGGGVTWVESNDVSHGAANLITLTIAGVTAYEEGRQYGFITEANNVGNTGVSLQINSLAVRTAVMANGVGIAANELPSNRLVIATYDGTFFRINVSPALADNVTIGHDANGRVQIRDGGVDNAKISGSMSATNQQDFREKIDASGRFHHTVTRNYQLSPPRTSTNEVTIQLDSGNLYDIDISNNSDDLVSHFLNTLGRDADIRVHNTARTHDWSGKLKSISDADETSAALRVEFLPADRTGTFTQGESLTISFGFSPRAAEADNVTIERNSEAELQVKPGGIDDTHIKSDMTDTQKGTFRERIGVAGSPKVLMYLGKDQITRLERQYELQNTSAFMEFNTTPHLLKNGAAAGDVTWYTNAFVGDIDAQVYSTDPTPVLLDVPNGVVFKPETGEWRFKFRASTDGVSDPNLNCRFSKILDGVGSTIAIGQGDWEGGAASSTRIWFVDNHTDAAVAYDHSGNRQMGDDITLAAGSWRGGVSSDTRIWFINGSTSMAVAYDHSGNRQMDDDINLGAGTWRDGTSSDTRIWIIDGSGATDIARAYDHSGNRQMSDDINLGTGTWRGAVKSSTRIWFISSNPATAAAYDHSGNRQMDDDINLGTGTWRGGAETSTELWIINDINDALAVGYTFDGLRIYSDEILDIDFTGSVESVDGVGGQIRLEYDYLDVQDGDQFYIWFDGFDTQPVNENFVGGYMLLEEIL